jgi:hypothetical protein
MVPGPNAANSLVTCPQQLFNVAAGAAYAAPEAPRPAPSATVANNIFHGAVILGSPCEVGLLLGSLPALAFVKSKPLQPGKQTVSWIIPQRGSKETGRLKNEKYD